MGTNYYVNVPPCNHCGHQPELVHIGTSSYGWRFCFDARFFNDVKQWESYLKDKEIVDEYGALIAVADFWRIVESKREFKSVTSKAYTCNHLCSTDGEHDFYNGEFC